MVLGPQGQSSFQLSPHGSQAVDATYHHNVVDKKNVAVRWRYKHSQLLTFPEFSCSDMFSNFRFHNKPAIGPPNALLSKGPTESLTVCLCAGRRLRRSRTQIVEHSVTRTLSNWEFSLISPVCTPNMHRSLLSPFLADGIFCLELSLLSFETRMLRVQRTLLCILRRLQQCLHGARLVLCIFGHVNSECLRWQKSIRVALF